jgi:hypothetical protein
MPIIFATPAGGGGESGCCPGNVIILGIPSDGTYDDGLLPFDENTFVSDAIDEINEVLVDMVPDPPAELDGTDLVGNRTLYTGILPIGLNSVWYQDGVIAGNTINRIIINNSITMSSANPSTRFNKGDEGTLIAKHNNGGSGLTVTGTLDIEANFNGSVVGPAVQDLSTWDNQGVGDPCTNAIVTFSGAAGNLEVTNVGWYNDFNAWQKMNAEINAASLQEGFHGYVMTHSVPTGDQSTNEYKFWYDDDPNALSFSVSPSVSENTISSNKYISGVQYYSTGDTFDITYSGSNIYRKCYRTSYVSRYRFDGESAWTNVNPITTPHYTDDIGAAKTIVIDRPNYYSTDARLTAYLYHPWKSSVNALSPSLNMLVATCGGDSTAKREYFCEEVYRLPNGSYNTVPSGITGQWNSQTILTNGQALIYNQQVQSANSGHNFTSYLPTGNPNYSLFSGNQIFLRAFYDPFAHSNVILTVHNIGTSDIGSLGSGNVNLEIKLPTQTGWLDAGTMFNGATFTGIDGDGCQVSMVNGSVTITFGTFSTANSGGMIIARFTFRNTNANCSYMAVNW